MSPSLWWVVNVWVRLSKAWLMVAGSLARMVGRELGFCCGVGTRSMCMFCAVPIAQESQRGRMDFSTLPRRGACLKPLEREGADVGADFEARRRGRKRRVELAPQSAQGMAKELTAPPRLRTQQKQRCKRMRQARLRRGGQSVWPANELKRAEKMVLQVRAWKKLLMFVRHRSPMMQAEWTAAQERLLLRALANCVESTIRAARARRSAASAECK